ncbi:uncharacterized protein LOC112600441 [Melanaphis sacchari]|uniref:uncharacterized protein LOC112600441 n=1 Tax=Melanaphis sacchari TaxID=742174 RepID=UPI000DC14D35|nr:uncharacterized protein LOC112600441 [Melanaphis sacchari]
MNRNNYSKGSPNWRPKQSINNTYNLTEKPSYTSRAGKMVEVLFGRQYHRESLTLLCTYFVANKRNYRCPNNRFKSFVENETFNSNFHPNKPKLCTTAIENEPTNKTQLYDKNSEQITAVLENLGFVCNDDKFYEVYPSKIRSHNVNKQFNTGYDSKTYTSPKPNNSIGSSDGYNQKGRYQKPIPSQIFLDKNRYNERIENYNYQNYQNYQNLINQKYTNSNCTKKPEQIPIKYWLMRHMLFTNFDHGIHLDAESFYSVCPEVLSRHIAKRCKNKIVLDPFCGAGGNIIQLAMTCKKVIAVDIDPIKIQLARHNAEIYGVADKIEFIVGDLFLIYPKLKADVVFMSPPWGGPEYSINKSYTIESMCPGDFGGGFNIFEIVKTIAPNIAFHMPKTTNIFECMRLGSGFGKVEIQQNIINGKLNSLTAFYGNFHWSN